MPDVIRELSPQLTETLRWSVYLKSHDEGFYGLYTESYKTSRKVHTTLKGAEKKGYESETNVAFTGSYLSSHLTFLGVSLRNFRVFEIAVC